MWEAVNRNKQTRKKEYCMESILEMVRHVVVFLLLATLIGNLFMSTEYKKYFSYATSLVVVIMVLVPLMQLLGKEGDWQDYLFQADYRQEVEQTKEEIQLLGKKYEKTVEKQYMERIREAIAAQCQTTKENCEIRLEGQQIRLIRVRVKKMPAQISSLISSLALCYGVEEENIFREEAD